MEADGQVWVAIGSEGPNADGAIAIAGPLPAGMLSVEQAAATISSIAGGGYPPGPLRLQFGRYTAPSAVAAGALSMSTAGQDVWIGTYDNIPADSAPPPNAAAVPAGITQPPIPTNWLGRVTIIIDARSGQPVVTIEQGVPH